MYNYFLSLYFCRYCRFWKPAEEDELAWQVPEQGVLLQEAGRGGGRGEGGSDVNLNSFFKKACLPKKSFIFKKSTVYFRKDALDTVLAGYPANPKAGYRISGRIFGLNSTV
jgi:hypothetical protein